MAQIYKRTIVRTDPAIKYPFDVVQDWLTVPVLHGYQYAIGLIKSGAITQIINSNPTNLTSETCVVFRSKADLTSYVANTDSLENSYAALALINTNFVDYCATNNMTVTYTSGSMPVPTGEQVELSFLEELVATLP